MHNKLFLLSLIFSVCCCTYITPASKIVGGHDAALGEAPWQVGLFTGESLLCGGTLLSPRVVVTAAHCMLWSFTVRLGGLDKRNLSMDFAVKEIFVHEDYNTSSSGYDHDIALVILNDAVNISLGYIQSACLPSNYQDYLEENVLISGWGTLSFGGSRPNLLQAAEVKIFSQDTCKESYRGYYYTDNMICAGNEGYSKDACQGDSGGPLVLREETSNTLLGITSWGIGCASQGYPGVYTNVANYVSWIKEKAGPSNVCINNTMMLGMDARLLVLMLSIYFIIWEAYDL